MRKYMKGNLHCEYFSFYEALKNGLNDNLDITMKPSLLNKQLIKMKGIQKESKSDVSFDGAHSTSFIDKDR